MIYFVTSRIKDSFILNIEEITFEDSVMKFTNWISDKKVVQLDVETPVIKDSPTQHKDRLLYTIQFGDLEGNDQYVIDMMDLSNEWKDAIILVLEKDITFIAHNAKFEYIVIKSNLGIELKDMHDTYLMSKIANTGLDLPKGYHGLAGCLNRYFDIEMDKTEQTQFTGDLLTINQIIYAAKDVVYLGKLYNILKELLEKWDLYRLYDRIERKILIVYSEMELTPMRLDVPYWHQLADNFITDANNIKEELNDLILKDPALVHELETCEKVMGHPLIQDKDEYFINWASTTFKRDMFKILVPNLPLDVKTKPAIKKYLKENNHKLPHDQVSVLNLYMSRSYDKLEDMLVTDYTDELKELEYFIPKGTLRIKWSSPVYRLFIFKFYYPNLEDTNAKSLVRIKKNPLINKFKEWVSANKRVTSYGENFLIKYVNEEGEIAPRGLQQILSTGRISFGILLQMPGDNQFRNAFLPPNDDDVFIDTDYASIEVVIMAYAAGEKPFIDAIKQGKDLHSMSASLLFPDIWEKSAEEGCEHLISGKRCKCKAHNKLRTFSKTITFGIAYGMSSFGLAERLDISKDEAEGMLHKFFITFPKLKEMFDNTSAYALKHNYIVGLSPVNRIRFFFHPAHEGERSAIARASRNFPIQEFSASILKVALIKLKKKIKEDNLPYKIHLPIHDEILSSCHKDDAEDLLKLQEQVMIESAEKLLAQGLINVDSTISQKWTK